MGQHLRPQPEPAGAPFPPDVDVSLASSVDAELPWLWRHIPLTRRIAADLRGLAGRSLCLNIHLDIKMAPVVDALVAAGARVVVLGCNPHTTRDAVVAWMVRRGAEVRARAGMAESDRQAAIRWALGQECEFVSEMGGDVLLAAAGDSRATRSLRAGMEATGTGIARLQGVALSVPVFNWDGLTLKQGLHNRHLVGLMVWATFLQVTLLTLYGRTVLVVGYGLVGQGLADYARRLGARVLVCELDPVRAHLARHHGCEVVSLDEGLARADVVVTATGREKVISTPQFPLLREGALLLNAGHSTLELDVPALRAHPTRRIRPHVEAVELGGRTVYLLAEGAMFNLAAGPGDPYDAFDLTSALMLAGIEYMVAHHQDFPPGLHLMPAEVERRVAALAAEAIR
ncbi:MAG: adenosylhomocysteinase [Armatimonadota bacterium]|nr:adenosylhomocysteinase [Armatimonadota bacterium]MDR7560156.1 adenosylhomocysteinase [Armatimonadota bacterium]MDR7581950.1 adenosylhomocysteinase [Armatimonadota bacterium]